MSLHHLAFVLVFHVITVNKIVIVIKIFIHHVISFLLFLSIPLLLSCFSFSFRHSLYFPFHNHVSLCFFFFFCSLFSFFFCLSFFLFLFLMFAPPLPPSSHPLCCTDKIIFLIWESLFGQRKKNCVATPFTFVFFSLWCR